MYRTDLQALILVGTPRDNPESDPLAVTTQKSTKYIVLVDEKSEK